ncbi:MAG TPA: phage portal protein [Methanomassiliicoccales archaeon]|nr:phage portal protein [Methanomassiliicoccales archaeon]
MRGSSGPYSPSFFDRVWIRLNEIVNPPVRPRTIAGTRRQRTGADLFSKRERSYKELDALEVRYLQGGPVREAIDSYPLFALSNGWYLDGKDEMLVKDTEAQLAALDIESSIWQGIIDSLVFGDAFQEIVTGRGQYSDTVLALQPRPAKMFDIDADEYGVKTGYRQYLDQEGRKYIPLALDQILHISLFHIGGSVYGTSLVNSAKDDIDRDVQMIESLVSAIERHGHPRYHAKVGKEGEDVGQPVLDSVADQLHDLKSNTELATCHDVEIVSLDTAGVGNTQAYSDLTLGRMACALGVPLDVLGVTEGSNRSTATVRQKVFETKISTIQRRIENIYNSNIIDRLTGQPGSVRFKFNDISPEDELREVEYVAKVLAADPISPIVGHEWARRRLRIPEEDAGP